MNRIWSLLRIIPAFGWGDDGKQEKFCHGISPAGLLGTSGYDVLLLTNHPRQLMSRLEKSDNLEAAG
jgi:hypothetical protein